MADSLHVLQHFRHVLDGAVASTSIAASKKQLELVTQLCSNPLLIAALDDPKSAFGMNDAADQLLKAIQVCQTKFAAKPASMPLAARSFCYVALDGFLKFVDTSGEWWVCMCVCYMFLLCCCAAFVFTILF
jgi:hypothetical protein